MKRRSWQIEFQEVEHAHFDRALVQRRSLDLVDQAGLAVSGLVPVVHAVQHRVGLVHHQGGGLGDGVELAVGYHDRHFDDAVALGREAGHLHVEPDQIVLVLRHWGYSWRIIEPLDCRTESPSVSKCRSSPWFS
jgi:hypothetical protein